MHSLKNATEADFFVTEAVSHPDGGGFLPLRLASYTAIHAVLHRKIGSVTT